MTPIGGMSSVISKALPTSKLEKGLGFLGLHEFEK
jgi:hypothetical protein